VENNNNMNGIQRLWIPIFATVLGALVAALLTAVVTMSVMGRDSPEKYLTVREHEEYAKHVNDQFSAESNRTADNASRISNLEGLLGRDGNANNRGKDGRFR
jgi:hypothetical protein